MGSMRNFRAADMPGNTKKVAYTEGTKPKATKSEPKQAPGVDPNAVPEGTAAEVMAWVGDDADRAQRALDAENKADRPRVTLIDDLERVILRDEDDEDEASDES